MGVNAKLVGKTYPELVFEVTREGMLAYARATQEEHPGLASDAAEVASPMYAVRWLLDGFMQGLFDPELTGEADVGRMVHAGQDNRFLKLVRPGDRITTRGRVVSLEDKGSGELLSLGYECRNQRGEQVLEALASFFFRAPPDPSRPRKAEAVGSPPGELLFEERLRVLPDQTVRYADASGDRNPIHMDEDFARAMGFPGVILQGLCTMAFAQTALLRRALAGDPARLGRLAVRFAKPVFLNDELLVRAWRRERAGELGFVVLNQRGEEVIRDGLAEFAAG
jgi:acyl dehydratase